VRAASLALADAARRGPVTRVRGAGLLLGLELAPGEVAARVRDRLLEHGVLVGTSNDPRVLRLSPGLTFPAAAAERLGRAFDAIAGARSSEDPQDLESAKVTS